MIDKDPYEQAATEIEQIIGKANLEKHAAILNKQNKTPIDRPELDRRIWTSIEAHRQAEPPPVPAKAKKPKRRPYRMAAAAAALFVVVAGLGQVTAVREAVLEIFTREGSQHTDHGKEYSDQDLLEAGLHFRPTPPEGYTISYIEARQNTCKVFFINGSGGSFDFQQRKNKYVSADNETATLEEVMINGTVAYLKISGNNVVLTWIFGEYQLILDSSTLDQDAMIAIAESVEKIQ